MYGVFVLHPWILNFDQNTLRHYETSVPSSLLHVLYDCKFKFSRELFKNTFTADRGQLRAEIEKNVFSNTSERLFLILQSVCGKVKLALNQQHINNTQNQTPTVVHFFVKKELGAVVHHERTQTPNWIFLFVNHLKKQVWVASGECRKNVEKRVK